MKNKVKFFGITVFTAILLVITGCASNVSNWQPYWNSQPVRLEKSSLNILGEVKLVKKWTKVLGIFQRGGITYTEFLEQARVKYPETDAIIDIHLDCLVTRNPFFEKREYTALGYAVKYTGSSVEK